MRTENKLDYLSNLDNVTALTESQKTVILQFCGDSDPEVRMRASELLFLFPPQEAESILIDLLKDKDYMVRASACDSLSYSSTKRALDSIIHRANDKSVLVRGYAVLSVGDIQFRMKNHIEETIGFLKKRLYKETSEWVKIIIYRSLFLLGESLYYPLFLEGLNNRIYRNRCLVINLLEDLLERDAVSLTDELRFVLCERYYIEKTMAVRQKLQELLNSRTGDGSVS